MRIDLGNVFQRILRVLHLSPLSLDQKCRLMFGSAVLLSLAIALMIPYAWLRQLTRKVLLDTHAARVESVLLRSHFQLGDLGRDEAARAERAGHGQGPERAGHRSGFRSTRSRTRAAWPRLTELQQKLLEIVKTSDTRDEIIALNTVDGTLQSDYVRVFRGDRRLRELPQSAGFGGRLLAP